MATKLWVSVSGNWDAGDSWSPAGVPANADNVVFDGTSQANVTAGFDQSGVTLATLDVREEYRGIIGTGYTDSTSVQINTSGKFTYKGSGRCYTYNCTFADLYVDAPNWNGAIWFRSCAVTNWATIARGRVTAYSSLGGRIGISYKTNPIGDAALDYYASTGGGGCPDIFMNGGQAIINDVDDMTRNGSSYRCKFNVAGGTLYVKDTCTDDIQGLAISGDGLVALDNRKADGTLVTDCNVFGGGVLTTMWNLSPGTIDELRVFPGGIALLHGNITVTEGGNIASQPIRR